MWPFRARKTKTLELVNTKLRDYRVAIELATPVVPPIRFHLDGYELRQMTYESDRESTSLRVQVTVRDDVTAELLEDAVRVTVSHKGTPVYDGKIRAVLGRGSRELTIWSEQ